MNASGRWASKRVLIGAVIAVVAVLAVSMVLSTAVAGPVPVMPGANTSPTAAKVTTTSTATSYPSTSNPTSARTSGHAEMYFDNPKTSGGPHPGVLDGYEIAPQGMTSEDPAVAYDTVSFEPILNVYQTLIAYNGTSTSNFVPELSTCVPGAPANGLSTPSVSCQDVYGSSLITDNALGQPQYWTFPISNASFYDPATGNSWPVYPIDVMFSLARTMSFADLPGPGVLNGWIQTQALTPIGNPSWDGAIHFPFNNTPGNIMTSMLINDSSYCPAVALTSGHGCITFDAYGQGTDWPFFLELVADPLGSGVVPCGWFTYESAGIPGWPGTTAAKGDGPCLLPGGVDNTQATGFTNYLSTLSPTAWDSFQELALNHPAVQKNVQFALVGSGPYYAAYIGQTTGYTLEANPAYVQPSGCVGVGGGCDPAPGQYIGKVVITYESTSTEGLAQYEAGQADFAEFFPSDTASILQLQSEGSIGVFYNPTISTFFLPFDLNFSVTAEAAIDPNAGELNVKGNFFASNTVRNLLTHAYPYTTIQNTVWTVDGVQFGHTYGGAIPIGMGDYYPTNVSFPYYGGDPCTGSTQSTCNSSVNSALWWWTQGTTSSSPYYDAELAACTTNNPCSFPIIGQLGDPSLDAAIADYIHEVGIITNNAIIPYSFDLSFPALVEYSSVSGGNNPMPYYNLGWAPDYPDPTDYMAAMYYANGTYTLGDSTYQVLETQAQYNLGSCGHNTGSWSDLVYWANYQANNGGDPIPNGCQGPAYGAMLTWMAIAASQAPGAYRVLIYNEVEHIENQLSFYLWYLEANGVGSAAKWINNATINKNVMIGGGGDQTFYLWQYTTATTNVYFNETGLPASTNWSVDWVGVPHWSDGTASVAVTGVTNGTYAYSINYQEGYNVGTSNGTVLVNTTVDIPTGVPVAVAFTHFTTGGCNPTLPAYPQATCANVAVSENGLITGTSWTTIIQTLGSLTTTNADPTFVGVPAGTYNYAALPSIGYTVTAPASITALAGTTATAWVTYSGISFTTYSITIVASGLTSGDHWWINLTGTNLTNTSTGATSSIVFWEAAGSYDFTVYSTTGLTPISPIGEAIVVAANQTIVLPFTSSPVELTFTEHGFPPGGDVPWGVTVIANNTNPTGDTGTAGGFTVPSTTTTTTFNVSAANVAPAWAVYNFSAIPLQGWVTEGTSGAGALNATSATSATIRFLMVVYPQSFYEVGLPAGALWTVSAGYTYPDSTVTNTSVISSLSDVLTMDLPNGTSPYTVTGPSGYTTPAGSLVVSAAAGFAIVVFTPVIYTYTVSFSQTGLPSGATWTVWVGNVETNGTGATINVPLINGTWTYGVTVPSGYTVSPSGGSFVVNGAPYSVAVTASAIPTSSSSVPTWAYALIGVFVALAVIFLITTLIFARRKPPTSTPPQSWQSSTEPSTSSTESTDTTSNPPTN